MATMIKTGNDVVSFLKGQHKQIKSMFAEVLATEGRERVIAFRELRRLMAVHETAEEEIVHPTARRALVNGDAVVEARLAEEKKAKEALTELETLDFDSPDFESGFSELSRDVLAHAESEEQLEFAKLAGLFDESRLIRMRQAVEVAESFAPTRAHAGVESATANVLFGPFASMVDRARDALSKK